MGRICNDCGHFVKDTGGKCLCPSKGEKKQFMEHKQKMEKEDEKQFESKPFDEVYGKIQKGDDNNLRIVLIGKTGSGKSATGNTLVGYKAFNAKASGKSVTRQCEKYEATRNGRKVVIVDTPGLFDTTFDSNIITLEIQRCINLTFPGPHLFLFVFGIGRFTLEENDAFEQFITIFGDDFRNHAVLVFTRLDDLEHDGMSIETYLEEACPDLKNALNRCNGRYIAVNNRLAKDDLERCSLSILEKLTLFINNNDKTFFQSPMHKYYKECIEEEITVAEKEQQTEMARVQSIYEKNLQCLQHPQFAKENDRVNHNLNDDEEDETSSDFDVDFDSIVNKTESKEPNEIDKRGSFQSKIKQFQELTVAADVVEKPLPKTRLSRKANVVSTNNENKNNDTTSEIKIQTDIETKRACLGSSIATVGTALDHHESREREQDELGMKRPGDIDKLREEYENWIKVVLEKVLEDERKILEDKRKRLLEAEEKLMFKLAKETEKRQAQLHNDEKSLRLKYRQHFDKMQRECDKLKGGLNERKKICLLM